MSQAVKKSMWPEMCHLSMLAGSFLPFGNVLGPLIIWFWKRKEDPAVDHHGREAVNFQISMMVYFLLYAAVGIALILWLNHDPSEAKVKIMMWAPAFFLPLVVIMFGGLVFALRAAIKANQGEFYQYPLALRIVR